MNRPLLYRDQVVIPFDPRLRILIPHAKEMTHNGQHLMVLPNKLDEVKVLRNLGYDAPPPILNQYDWMLTTPFDAQRITAAHITMNPSAFVLNAIGTGKTRASLFAFDYMQRIGAVKKLLVVTPLSTVRQVWGREIITVFPHLRTQILTGDAATRRKRLAMDADVYVINHDGIEVIFNELMARRDIDMAVLDELSVYKTQGTDRWKVTNKLMRRMQRVVGMTATPIPNEPTDAYAQTKIVNPSRCENLSMSGFREGVMTKITTYKYVPKQDAVDKVFKFMQPSVRFTRDECFDLPPCQTVLETALLTPQQAELYKALVKECSAGIKAKTITPVNEADLANKLVQVALGTVITSDKSVERLACAPRLEVLERAVEQSASKVIVFTPYKASLAMLYEHLCKRWTCEQVSGDVSPTARDHIFTRFMQSPDPHVIVAHPACMSHGLTLTEASTIVWYGPPLSLEMYEQANGRITRPGQKHSQLILNIAATKVEEQIYARLNRKAKTQGLLLDLFESQELSDLL